MFSNSMTAFEIRVVSKLVADLISKQAVEKESPEEILKRIHQMTAEEAKRYLLHFADSSPDMASRYARLLDEWKKSREIT